MIIRPTDEKKAKRFALRLLRSIDPSYRIRWKVSTVSKYTWDGSGLLRMSESNIIYALHDVAHALLSSEARRRLPEFGLGPDPANGSDAPRVVRREDAQWEEDHVCELQWCFAVYFWGWDGGEHVVNYVSLLAMPTFDKISAFAERFPALPDDFEPVIRKVIEERQKTPRS